MLGGMWLEPLTPALFKMSTAYTRTHTYAFTCTDTVYVYMYECMYHIFFSLNHFRVLEVSCPYTPKYFSVYMLGARKSILLHNLSAVINSGNLSLILHCYLTYSSYSNFINYFNGMLYSYMYFLPGLGSKSTYGIKLSSFFTLC